MKSNYQNVQKLLDQFGRKHDYLRVSLTERCNLRCIYCMPEEGIQLRDRKEFMTSEELVSIAKIFVDLGVRKIRITGGEPLIKKNFASIIHELGKLPVELALTTNGILVDKFLQDFKNAGIQKINVSLDSLREERFNAISRREYYCKIRENIQLLHNEGFDLKINVVLIKGVNDDEICDFVKWSFKEKVHIRFIEFMPFDGNKWDASQQVTLKQILNRVKSYFGEQEVIRIEDAPNDTSKNYQIRGGIGTFGIISSITNPFCDSCNRIRLTADGKIKNCLFSQTENDLLGAFRQGHDILPLIIDSIQSKFKERGGVFNGDHLKDAGYQNRPMTSIGG